MFMPLRVDKYKQRDHALSRRAPITENFDTKITSNFKIGKYAFFSKDSSIMIMNNRYQIKVLKFKLWAALKFSGNYPSVADKSNNFATTEIKILSKFSNLY